MNSKTAFETDRFFALPLDPVRDLANCFAFNSNAEAMRFIRPTASDPEFIRAKLQRLADYRERCADAGLWMLFSKPTGQFLGNCLAWHADFDPQKSDQMEIGYGFMPEFWGAGLATETVRVLSAFVLEKHTPRRLVGIVHPENLGSQKALTKNGFAFEKAAETPDGLRWVFQRFV